MTGPVQIRVGEPWPYPLADGGMQTLLDVTEAGISLAVVASIDEPSSAERAALRGPLRLSVTTLAPITWIVLDAGAVSWDAPFARGIASPGYSARVGRALDVVAAWPPETRGLCEIYVIDRGRVHLIRTVTLSRAWWLALARSVAAPPDQIPRAAYLAAVEQQMRIYQTPDLMALAVASEVAGRL